MFEQSCCQPVFVGSLVQVQLLDSFCKFIKCPPRLCKHICLSGIRKVSGEKYLQHVGKFICWWLWHGSWTKGMGSGNVVLDSWTSIFSFPPNVGGKSQNLRLAEFEHLVSSSNLLCSRASDERTFHQILLACKFLHDHHVPVSRLPAR